MYPPLSLFRYSTLQFLPYFFRNAFSGVLSFTTFSTFLQLLQCFLPPTRSWNRAISLLPEYGHDAQLSGKYGCLSEKFKTELPYIIGATQVVSELMQVKKVQIKNL